jgi:hypothetical protein
MNNSAWTATLLDVLQRERRSLLPFVAEAYPWASAGEEAALARLRAMIEEEQQAAVRLALYLQHRHVTVPPVGPFPLRYTTLNFVSLDFLVPSLIAEQKQRIAELDRDLPQLTDPEARQQVQAFREMKVRHLKALEELTAQAPKAVHA